VAPTILSQVDYQVVERIVLTNAGPGVVERLTLWVALIRSLEPYQDVLDLQVQPAPLERFDDEYGNSYARIEFYNLAAGQSIQTVVTSTVSVNELAHDLSTCFGETPSTSLDPETYVESDDPDIEALALELSSARGNACESLRALYDYVGDNISYTTYESGDRGAVWALDHRSGDCTEFADALLALSRAAGIPARFLEGVTYREDETQDPGQIKHDWLEAYLPGHGWVPLDPTWGRFPNKRDAYFARISPDHIIVTVGRNLSTLGRYHYFYYNWRGAEVSLSHQEAWTVSKLP
jgi:transglutaminase-like putative cysteine protease